MDLNKELYDAIKDFSERGKDLDNLREEIFEYIKENCTEEDQDKFSITDSQKEIGTPFEANLMATALFRGYHVLVDELAEEIEEFYEIVKAHPDLELCKTLTKFKKNIQLAREYFMEVKLKGH